MRHSRPLGTIKQTPIHVKRMEKGENGVSNDGEKGRNVVNQTARTRCLIHCGGEITYPRRFHTPKCGHFTHLTTIQKPKTILYRTQKLANSPHFWLYLRQNRSNLPAFCRYRHFFDCNPLKTVGEYQPEQSAYLLPIQKSPPTPPKLGWMTKVARTGWVVPANGSDNSYFARTYLV